jgi:hypothetical protein
MKRSLRAGLIGALLLGAGCSGGGGFLGTGYLPKGDITITDPTTGAVLNTSPQAPYLVSAGSFPIGIAETNFGGPYAVSLIKWYNGFDVPCFEPQNTDTTDHVNVVTFVAVNANKPGTTGANPCTLNDGDEETAQITDGKGHTVYFYYYFGTKLPSTLPGSKPAKT